jgi:two-component system chemotaxis sensor kinase CheA
MGANDNDDLLRDFLAESRERLLEIETDLLAIEAQGERIDEDRVNKVFRAAHSIKSSSGFVGLHKIQTLAHKTENVLGMIRSRELAPGAQIIDILLRTFDKLRYLINQASESNAADIGEHVAALSQMEGRVAPPEKNQEPPAIPAPSAKKPDLAAGTAPPENTLRVSVDAVETLLTLAGELVLGRNQLDEALARRDEKSVKISSQRISKTTTELHNAILQARMQPIGNVFGKFHRLVRDMSHHLGKSIRLEIEGADVELDKTQIEGLADPLTHIISNALDHGIEPSEERAACGKPAAGTILLRAWHEAGFAWVEITDDGRGIDPAKVAASALEKGLINPLQLQGLSDKDKIGLIFMPGLSTATQVSEISGRGVGMDVVKTNLDRLGGQVDIESAPGRGCSIKIKLPLTLAIIPSLVVGVEGERFAIPQANILELVRIAAEQVKHKIRIVGDAEALSLRGSLIPLVRLTDVLGIPRTYLDPVSGQRYPDRRQTLSERRSRQHVVAPADAPAANAAAGIRENTFDRRNDAGRRMRSASDLNLVVLSAGTLHYGLAVDVLHRTQECVVKPLGVHLKALQEYAGAAIMGDGKAALILDAPGLARKAGLFSLAGFNQSTKALHGPEQARQEMHTLLRFQNAPGEFCAVPLNQVRRVEYARAGQIQTRGEQRMLLAGRNAGLPLVTLAGSDSFRSLEEIQTCVVIVFSFQGGEAGLLASKPVDFLETQVSNIAPPTQPRRGMLGSILVEGLPVVMVDLEELALQALPQDSSACSGTALSGTVLLAEDSGFFRSQVRRLLTAAGLTVLEAADGEAAWELLQAHGGTVRALVTDIEMPRLSGLDLSRRIRADARFVSLPVIALSSLAEAADIARGKAAGVTEYLVKLDREQLLSAVRRVLSPEIKS